MGRIVFALFFRGIYRKFLEEIFISAANQVFFLAESFVADFVYLIDQFFDVICRKVPCRKCSFDKAAFQLFVAGCKAVQRSIQRHIEFWRWSIDDRWRPTGLYGQVICPICESGVYEECFLDLLVIWIKSLLDQSFTKILNAVLKLFSDETQKYKRQHHVAFLEKRTGVTGLT